MEGLAKHSEGSSFRVSNRGTPLPPLPKIQVKSQNPISKPPAEQSRPHSPPGGGDSLSQDRRHTGGGPPKLQNRSPKPTERPRRDGPSRAPSQADTPKSPHQFRGPAFSAAGKAKSPDRLRGGGGPSLVPDATPKSPNSPAGARPRTPKSPKSPVRSPKTPSFVPPDVITPVFPASKDDMIGAQTSVTTGLTYPYNAWGPVTKYGYLDNIPPTWAQKHHFEGKHDKLAKKRLQRRNFSFVRHPAYKELIEPEHKACTSYLDPKRKEFWRTDVSNVLKREMQVEKDRYKRLLEFMGNEEEFRKGELQRDRDDRWQAFLDYDKNVKLYPGFRNNQSGVKYDIFTHAPTDEYEEKRVNAEKMKAQYMLAKRGLYIQERMSGARPYDILSWRKLPPCRDLPPWPQDIGPPPDARGGEGVIPLNASKGALSLAHPFGPFATLSAPYPC